MEMLEIMEDDFLAHHDGNNVTVMMEMMEMVEDNF
jgi:flagellar basal body rod protein FlgB